MSTITQSETQQEQFTEAFSGGYQLTRRFLVSRGAGPDAAEEIAQAAWVRGWECRNQLRQPEMLGAWINSIAKNMLTNFVRCERKFDDLLEMPSAPTSTYNHLDAETILNQCGPTDSDILSDYYLKGYTTGEIAKRIGLCPATVRVRLLRLRRALRSRLDRVRPEGRSPYFENLPARA